MKMVHIVIVLNYQITLKRLRRQVRKNVYRIINKKTGKAEGDYITLENENPYDEKPLKLFHPVHTYKMKFIKSFEAIDLHHNIYENGN